MAAMNDASALSAAGSTQVRHLQLVEFLHLVGGFWRGPTGHSAWMLTFSVLSVAVLEILVQLGFNAWNGWFFDILDGRRAGTITEATVTFVALAVVTIGAGVVGVLCRMLLQVRWRAWLTGEMLDSWLSESRFMRLVSIGGDGNNPEYRIADDVRLSTEPVTDFVTGLISAVLMSVAFLGLLWTLGGTFAVSGIPFAVPGYMVFAVLLYSAVAWLITILLGGGYADVVRARNEAEARLRYELIHLREQAAGLSVTVDPARERAGLGRALAHVVGAWTRVAHRSAQMTWVSYGNTIVAPVVPLLLVAHKYLSGEMSLGTVMQVSMAFVQVQAALNWFVANYARLSEWYASVVRVLALQVALDDLSDCPSELGSVRPPRNPPVASAPLAGGARQA
jgi:putative ATP-binding cassette transporter